MREFSAWLGRTDLSLAIQSNLWVIPLVQSIHIVAIGVVLASVFMVMLRVLNVAGRDLTLVQTNRRFGPWMWGALVVLAVTGATLVIGEPTRNFISLSFWLKMIALAIGIIVAIAFQLHLRGNAAAWEDTITRKPATRVFAIGTFVVWCLVVAFGRLIAFDAPFWGSLSPQAV